MTMAYNDEYQLYIWNYIMYYVVIYVFAWLVCNSGLLDIVYS